MTHNRGLTVNGFMSVSLYFTQSCSDIFIPVIHASARVRLYALTVHDSDASLCTSTSGKSATKLPFSRSTLTTVVASALRRSYCGIRHAAKHLANKLNIEPKSARAFIDGRRTPCSWNLIQMMALSRDLRADVNALIDAIEIAHQGRHNAQFWDGNLAPTRLGDAPDWGHDGLAFRRCVFLVDVNHALGRAASPPAITMDAAAAFATPDAALIGGD